MLEALISLDQSLFLFLNGKLANPIFDWLMPILRYRLTWLPLYILITSWLIYRYRLKGAFMILTIILCVGASDQISSQVIKPAVERQRPCQDPEIAPQVRMVVTCGSGYSFTSSHAANHFSMAVLLILFLFRDYRFIIPVALVWALSIVFAQIYVGVHYPLDILGGAILGGLLAIPAWMLFQLGIKKLNK
jgi:undecaprenyl-diphosphatase